MRGLFITFEGPDGAGKTTQLKLLADFLIGQGYDVVTTREPGGTPISDKIRNILLDPNHKELTDQTEILLYAASRAQLVHETILPALNRKKIVLCDRFIDASIAYQAYGLEINRKIVEEINRFASSGLRPDRTYLLNISPESGRKRLIDRNRKQLNGGLDRIEQKGLEYHQRVQNGFLTLAGEQADRILTIDADVPQETIFQMIKEDIKHLLKKLRKEE